MTEPGYCPECGNELDGEGICTSCHMDAEQEDQAVQDDLEATEDDYGDHGDAFGDLVPA